MTRIETPIGLCMHNFPPQHDSRISENAEVRALRDILFYCFMPHSIICGSTIEVVDSWSHVGHVCSKDCDDKRDIGLMNGRTRFISQVNNIICVFCKLDCVTKMRLLKAYCSSFYGSELWDLANDSMATYGLELTRCT